MPHLLNRLKETVAAFNRANLSYALIGGLALGFHGAARATRDIDFAVVLDDLEAGKEVLASLGFKSVFESENVTHLQDENELRLDLLHAFRRLSRGLLERTQSFELSDRLAVPVAGVEDLVGLKLQALNNDPRRQLLEWSDIQLLMMAAAAKDMPMDWPLIDDYLETLDMQAESTKLRSLYGSAE